MTWHRRADVAAEPLRVDPVTPLPARIAVGGGGALFVDGRCSHPAGPIGKLTVSVEIGEYTVHQRAAGWEMAPPPTLGGGNDYWWAVLTLPSVDDSRRAKFELCAQLRDGTHASGRLGTAELVPRLETADVGLSPPIGRPRAVATAPLVAVCMATYNPPSELLRRQIESIRGQTHDNWVCVVSDGGSSAESIEALRESVDGDDRFRLCARKERLGVYENFERALLMVPAGAEYVALCDQDDEWHPDKLEELLAGIEPGARLVYSDARLVDTTGRVIAETLWRAGDIDHADFASLMMTTSRNIPGASMLFEASLLDDILPFPPRYRGLYHDFWIARVALALGKVSYVPRPLYDYVQHGEQTLGASPAPTTARGRTAAIRHRFTGLRNRGIHPSWRRSLYFDDYLRVLLAARALEARCGGRMSGRDRRTLRAVVSPTRGIAWLALRATRARFGANETRGGERKLLTGLVWRQCAEWGKWLRLGARRFQAARARWTRAR
jgi:glycosyltransferase involved in cell wall biosynthesis